ncbi:DUF2339 domain-containing protein [Pinisolibacter aquiterrae]|uniref:DUF2339 domain-containing protein n=1 Tax=Pinisolibacter aquiterrae TaxID=2815579 RepID=UPI001C3E2715|nr:DUF2339 domain-containing protein [Pinisolibacter aquiterrae]MCC8235738.1 DUF2339 domain-containing protein [Pinisolibacter aquiterrae]
MSRPIGVAPSTEAPESRGAGPTAPPRRPDIADAVVGFVREWLFGGNLVVRIGIVVLFFGGAFLLKYASDNSLLPIELRLAATALAATALLAVGWRLAPRRRGYGLTLEGGGVGVLYLTVFAAARLYDLVPPSFAFPLLIVVCALAAFLAVRQDALALAVFGSVGGFLAPILMSTGSGSHIGLFGYYAVLDAGILGIAWFKAWRPLNLVGFVFTFTVGAAWGATQYRPEMLVSVELFLILFVVMFVGIALLHGLRRDLSIRHYVDGTLVFGVPIAAAGLQAQLTKDIPFGLAFSAAGLATFYLAVAGVLRRRPEARPLFEAMLGVGIVFATLAIPFAFSGTTTGAAWAIEGAALVGLGLRQGRASQFWFGLLMQVAGAIAVLTAHRVSNQFFAVELVPFLNGDFLARSLVAVAAFFTGWMLHTRGRVAFLPEGGAAGAAVWPLAWALLWWVGGGLVEADRFAYVVAGVRRAVDLVASREHARDLLIAALLVFFALSAVLLDVLSRRLDWGAVRRPTLALVPAVTVVMMLAVELPSPLAGWRVLGVLVAFTVAYGLLRRQEARVPERLSAALHALAFFDISLLVCIEAIHQLGAVLPSDTWRFAADGALPGLLLLVLSRWGHRLAWPIGRYPVAHQVWAATPGAVYLILWGVLGLASDGNDQPLVWLPILNPLDLAVVLVGLALVAFHRRLAALGQPFPASANILGLFAGLAALWGAFWLRVLHHGFGAPYHLPEALIPFDHQLGAIVVWCGFVAAALRLSRDTSGRRSVTIGAGAILVGVWLWVFAAGLVADGGRWTVVPLANPFDLVQGLVWGVTAIWLARSKRDGLPVETYAREIRAAAIAMGFLWINAMLLRGLHHWGDIPYTPFDLARSTVVQATLSIFWTICALIVMVGASVKGLRPVWFVGAGLLGATIAKLFVFDLSHLEGVTRIIAFIGIGMLLLLIGYFSPLPPKVAAPNGESAS